MAATNTTPRERVAGRQHINRTRFLSLLAGIGFALFFIALSRTSEDGGLFPLIGARGASVAALAIVLSQRREWERIVTSNWTAIVIAGALDCAANSLYLIAVRMGNFTWVAAIASLYPVSTVLLARIFLNEKLQRIQIAGLVLAGLALATVALGAG